MKRLKTDKRREFAAFVVYTMRRPRYSRNFRITFVAFILQHNPLPSWRYQGLLGSLYLRSRRHSASSNACTAGKNKHTFRQPRRDSSSLHTRPTFRNPFAFAPSFLPFYKQVFTSKAVPHQFLRWERNNSHVNKVSYFMRV